MTSGGADIWSANVLRLADEGGSTIKGEGGTSSNRLAPWMALSRIIIKRLLVSSLTGGGSGIEYWSVVEIGSGFDFDLPKLATL